MEKKNNSGMLVGILIGLVIALLVGVGLFATGNINFKTNANTDNKQAEDSNNITDNNSNGKVEEKDITQKTFEDIVDNELYILFGFKSLNEITNERKLTLAFNLIDKEYAHSDNDVWATVQSVSKTKVEKVFNNTSISKLGIIHQKFDVYNVNDTHYNRNNNYMSKRNLFYCGFKARKFVNYEEKNNQYILSVNYIFPDSCEGWEKFYGAYGYENQNESNFVVNAHNDAMEYIKPQEYLDDNYDSIKDKLDTYVYTFEVDGNNKINLVDFSIK